MVAVVRGVRSGQLRPREVAVLRQLFDAAWADEQEIFTDQDWGHAVGGIHFLLEEDGEIRAHASVVERELHAGENHLAAGYVEAVATWPAHQRRGYGPPVMGEVDAHIDRAFSLGALDTGRPGFYQRLGWVVWEGPTYVRTETGLIRTDQDDGAVLVRRTPTSPDLDLSAPIS